MELVICANCKSESLASDLECPVCHEFPAMAEWRERVGTPDGERVSILADLRCAFPILRSQPQVGTEISTATPSTTLVGAGCGIIYKKTTMATTFPSKVRRLEKHQYLGLVSPAWFYDGFELEDPRFHSPHCLGGIGGTSELRPRIIEDLAVVLTHSEDWSFPMSPLAQARLHAPLVPGETVHTSSFVYPRDSRAPLVFEQCELHEGRAETETRITLKSEVHPNSLVGSPVVGEGGFGGFGGFISDAFEEDGRVICTLTGLPEIREAFFEALASTEHEPTADEYELGEPAEFLGGPGELFHGHCADLDRGAVVRILRGAAPVGDAVRQFELMADTLVGLRHSCVARVHAIGTSNGDISVVSESLGGQTLAERVQTERPSAWATLSVVRQIARGLAAGHYAGVLHRNLTPGGVQLVEPGDGAGPAHAKLTGLGVLALHDAARTDGDSSPGLILGNPVYVSPEQCGGGAGWKVGPRSDLYVLGCIMYFMLTQEPPFNAAGLSVIQLHLGERPVAPRKRYGRADRELEAITLKLLAKHPQERFRSCRELLAALDDTELARSYASAEPTARVRWGQVD